MDQVAVQSRVSPFRLDERVVQIEENITRPVGQSKSFETVLHRKCHVSMLLYKSNIMK